MKIKWLVAVVLVVIGDEMMVNHIPTSGVVKRAKLFSTILSSPGNTSSPMKRVRSWTTSWG